MFEKTTSTSTPFPFFPSAERSRVANESLPKLTTRFLKGRKAILRYQPMLAELAFRGDQEGDADNLAHFLTTPDALKKTPYLMILAEESGVNSEDRAAGDVVGAVLLFEYRLAHWINRGGSRVFSTADGSGRRSVFGPSERRAQLAAHAARTLVGRGAQIVHIAFSATHRVAPSDLSLNSSKDAYSADAYSATQQGLDLHSGDGESIAIELSTAQLRRRRMHGRGWTLMEHRIPLYLPLETSFNATLARVGRRTRSNLRYYRRRSEADLGCGFVPEVEISLPAFLKFNRECTYAVSDELAAWRYKTLNQLSNPFLRGIQDGEGRWLSLVGGRRQRGFAEIDWQMNRADLPAYSLSTVMRSYLLEHEIGLGSTRLYFEGGTPHPLREWFTKGRVGELTVKRQSLYVWLLQQFAPRFFPSKNYLAQVLNNAELHWKTW